MKSRSRQGNETGRLRGVRGIQHNMSSRSRKRQKTDPSQAKPDTKTLFHFFSKPTSNEYVAESEALPLKTDSNTSINHAPRRKSDVGVCAPISVAIINEMTPPRMPTDEVQIESESQEKRFKVSVTKANDTCSPTKEERDEIESMKDFDFRDDEYREEGFCDDELDFPYEDIDDIFDDVNQGTIKPEQIDRPTHTPIDEGPSCPFCNFSFNGLSDNVLPFIRLGLIIVNNGACKPMP